MEKRKNGEASKLTPNKKSRTLSGLLVRTLVSTFLPVNLLAIIACSMILIQASIQVRESYQRELDTVMNQMQSDLEETEDAFSDFLLDYMTELTLAADNDSMTPFRMITDLREDFAKSGGRGLYYLYDKEQKRLYLRYSGGVYEITLVEEMKEALREIIESDEAELSKQWEILPLSGEYFLSRQYDYTNYRIGFLLDMELTLQERGQSPLWRDNQVYLESDGTIYTYREDRLRPYRGDTWEELFQTQLLERHVQWQNENPDIAVGIHMVNPVFSGSVSVAYWVLLAMAVCSIFLAVGMWVMLKRRVVLSLYTLYHGLEELQQEHLSYRIQDWDQRETEEFVYLYESFNHMAEEIGLSREKDIQMYQVQLDNLRLQVNPHMLLNSFNMIYSLAQSKNFQCIQEYSLLLVEYFRYSLKDTGRLVPLSKEMEFVENYINIQKIRFPGAFTSVYNVQKDCGEALIPPLLVENFVENAMKYALQGADAVEVLINIRREEERLLVSVCDTGRGIKPEILESLQKGEIYVDKMGRQHIGVWNCRRRLEVFYQGDAKMTITSSPGAGTQVWLDLPFRTQRAETVEDGAADHPSDVGTLTEQVEQKGGSL